MRCVARVTCLVRMDYGIEKEMPEDNMRRARWDGWIHHELAKTPQGRSGMEN